MAAAGQPDTDLRQDGPLEIAVARAERVRGRDLESGKNVSRPRRMHPVHDARELSLAVAGALERELQPQATLQYPGVRQHAPVGKIRL